MIPVAANQPLKSSSAPTTRRRIADPHRFASLHGGTQGRASECAEQDNALPPSISGHGAVHPPEARRRRFARK